MTTILDFPAGISKITSPPTPFFFINSFLSNHTEAHLN